jgi:cytochrome c556
MRKTMELKKTKLTLLNALLISGLFSSPLYIVANANALDATSIVESRQQKLKELGKAMKTINQQLKSDSPELSLIQQQARLLAKHAAELPQWFPLGTGQDAGLDTDALNAIWSQPDDFTARAKDFKQASLALSQKADKAELATLMQNLKEVKDSCSGCHKNFRADD